MARMFSNTELLIIWFALIREQYAYEKGTHKWFRYERMIRKIEDEVGASKRPHLTVINTDKEDGPE